MLLILSPWAVNSRQVYRELLLADKYGIPVIPVKSGRVDLPEKFEYFLCDVTVKDISGFEYESEIASPLISELIRIAGKAPEEIKECAVKEEVYAAEVPAACAPDESCGRTVGESAADTSDKKADRIKAVLPVLLRKRRGITPTILL